ncbi:ATP-binding protein [Neopusillimonas aromaticivorans]|uniref:ATP-binding protein n=1 Tax=Neopusillimonas aromaticivorans TaxID=2979868 RepID=UPI0025981325|nr:ATP-binding protein [Neopusillimonas aromaticivorans]WJJ93754.1 ATP-binding protein [Neopusillimonas aromaticivorans]
MRFFAPEKRQPSERIFDDIGVVGEYRPLKSPEQCHETCAGDGMTRRVERSFSAKMNKSGWTKEGRKFGLALWLSTQRPSEISPTVLSQCNNWVTFRLTSEKDLNAVQTASEWADRRDIKRIAGLARQTAVVFGGSISMPTMLRAPDASPRPRSDDGAFASWGVS